jgi:hypothetical protein
LGVRCQGPPAHVAPKTIETPPLPPPPPKPEPGDSLTTGEILTNEHVLEEMNTATTRLPCVAAPPHRLSSRRVPRRIRPLAIVTGALVLFTWLALPAAVRARFHLDLPRAANVGQSSAPMSVPTASSIRVTALPSAPAEPAEPIAPAPTEPPADLPNQAPFEPAQTASPRQTRKSGGFRSVHSSSRKPQHSASSRTHAESTVRAGRLSSDDF